VDHPFEISEVVFYLCVYGMAFLSGCSRVLLSGPTVSCRNVFAVGLNSGFLGFAVVAILCRNSNAFVGVEFFYLGVAAVMGLAGKEQDRVVSILWRNLLGKFGIEESAQCKLDDRNDKESKEHNE
jgi:hypothetical protein